MTGYLQVHRSTTYNNLMARTENIIFRATLEERAQLEAQAHYRWTQFGGRGMESDTVSEYMRLLCKADALLIEQEIARAVVA